MATGPNPIIEPSVPSLEKPVVAAESPNLGTHRVAASGETIQHRPGTPNPGLTSEGSRNRTRRPAADSEAPSIRGEVRQLNSRKTDQPFAEIQGFWMN